MQYLEALSHRYLRERGNFHCDTNTFFFFQGGGYCDPGKRKQVLNLCL